MANTVTVKMRNTLGYMGKYYGPGDAVEVPEALARAMGLETVEQPKAAKQSTPRKSASAQKSRDERESDTSK